MSEKKYMPLHHTDDLLPLIRKIALFGGLSKKQLDALLTLLRSVSYDKDEIIFQQNEQPTHIYIVKSGDVRLVLNMYADSLEIADFIEGDCFGETGVIGIQPHSASAIAIVPTELIVLTADALHSLYDIDKEIFSVLILNIAREACRRLHKTDEIFLHYVHNGKR